MTFSALAGGRRLALGYFIQGGKKYRRFMARNAPKVVGIIHHHIVGDIDALQRELLRTSRTLSVNYGIARDGTIHGCVSEKFKANTTSHSADHSHVTVENANESLAPEYRISDATFDSAARLTADVARRHGFVPSASTVRFHRQFVSTACPGPYFWDRRDEFIALARKYYDGGAPAKPEPSKPSNPKPAPTPPSTGGLPAAGVAMLQGVGIGDQLKLSNWALYNDPGLSLGKRYATGTYKIVSITYKYRGGIEPSLQLEDSRGGRAWAHYSAVRGVLGKGSKPKPTPAPARKSVAQLATEVLAGKWGNGADRKRRLQAAGYSYAAVQAEVNRRLR